ncbi:MAG: TetR/AcrR family transcriptional regulator [Candidatus Binataceae bacterium]
MSNLQEERSAETRRRILEATVLSLAERGYTGTTIAEVAVRAGVSRGAEMHHFPKKEALVIAALEYVFEQRVKESREIAKLPTANGTDRLSYVVDLLWAVYKGPAFQAWIELVVASRTDPALREAVLRISQGFSQASIDIWQDLLRPNSLDPDSLRVLDRIVNGQLEAIAISRILYPPSEADRPELREMVEWTKKIGRFLLDQRAANAPRAADSAAQKQADG